jgi:S-DNA-T family DNA segregation ATPase FtsK/SpoIIIE
MQGNESQLQRNEWKGAKPWPEILAGLVVISVGIVGYVIWYQLSTMSTLLADVVTLIEIAIIGILAVRFQGWLQICRWMLWRNRLYSACIASGDASLSKSPPKLRRVTKVPGGWELDVRLRKGTTQASLERISDSLKSSFKATDVTIHRGDRGDHSSIHVQKKGPFGGPPPSVPSSFFQRILSRDIGSIPIGLDERGREISMRLRAGGALVAGLPGSGKSNMVHLLVAHSVGIAEAKVYLIDPKRVELARWKARATRFGTSQEDAIDILGEVVVAMEQRYQKLERLGARKVEIDMGPMLVVIEEVSALLVGQQGKVIEELLRRVMMMGRAAGVLVVLVAQRPGVDTIPASLRDLAETRIAFRTSTSDMSDTILGRGSASRGFDASKISADTRGVGYLSSGDGEVTLMRCYYVDDKTLATLQDQGCFLSPDTGETR